LEEQIQTPYCTCCVSLLLSLLGIVLHPEFRGSMLLRNIGEPLPDYTASHFSSTCHITTPTSDCSLVLPGYLLDLHFDSEDGGSAYLWNIGEHLPDYTASHFSSTCHITTPTSDCCLVLPGYLLYLLFDSEDGGSAYLWNIGEHLPDYTASHFSSTCHITTPTSDCCLILPGYLLHLLFDPEDGGSACL
jgi:hypothetical protein